MVEAIDTVITISILTSLFWFKITYQNVKGFGKNRKWSPEDEIAFKENDESDPEAQNTEKTEFTSADRWTNINENDKENIPYTLLLMWGILIIGDDVSIDVLFYTAIIYTLFRLLHTIFYYLGINQKPLIPRSFSWLLGQIAAAILAIMLPVGAIRIKIKLEE